MQEPISQLQGKVAFTHTSLERRLAHGCQLRALGFHAFDDLVFALNLIDAKALDVSIASCMLG